MNRSRVRFPEAAPIHLVNGHYAVPEGKSKVADWSFIGQKCRVTPVFGATASRRLGRSRRVSGHLSHLIGMRDEPSATGLERMLSTRELAEHLGIAPQAIYDLRTAGRGPRAIHVGRELRYRVSEIQAWLDRMSEPASGADGARDAR